MQAELKKIDALRDRLMKFELNLKKCSAANRTEGYLEGRLVGLEEIWKQICEVNEVILTFEEKESTNEYFVKEEFSGYEDKYFSLMGQIKDQLKAIRPQQQANVNNSQHNQNNPHRNQQQNVANNQSKVKLPKITLPTFSGSYHTWMSFKNRFSNLIHDSAELSNVEKLEYLKSCVTGVAERSIRHFQITDHNYTSAWNKLNDKYDNKRILQDTQIETIIDRRPIKNETAKELRDLIDVTEESLESLRNLNVDTSGWGAMLVVLIKRKLPFKTREEWEKEVDPKDVPTYKELIDFLEKRYRTVESLELVGESSTDQPISRHNQFKNQVSKDRSFQQSNQKTCIACNNERHSLVICEKFLNMNQSNRNAFVNAKRLCRNCLAVSHVIAECKSSKTCFKCGKKHHTLLHREEIDQQSHNQTESTFAASCFRNQSRRNSNFDSRGSNQNQMVVNKGIVANQSSQSQGDSTNQNVTSNQRKSFTTTTTTLESETGSLEVQKSIQRETLFPTAIIKVRSEGGIVHKLRALLDQCSDDEAFIKESTAKNLGWKQVEIPSFEVTGMDEVVTARINKATKFELIIEKDQTMEIEASVVKNLVGVLPKTVVQWPEKLFQNLKLADPHFATPNNVDIMLGGNVFAEILLDGILKKDGYLAQNTKLGWIISGGGKQQSQSQKTCLHTRIITSAKEIIETDEILKKFWEMEEAPRKMKKLNEEEIQCEEVFRQSYRRLEDGRIQVKLPFKESPSEMLGESRSQAVARWLAMERKLEKDQQLKNDYMASIKEHLDLGHMEKLSTLDRKHEAIDGKFNCYYIPHHAVIREESKTTKTRIVFDASAKTSTKISLNDILMVGPTIQESLIVRLMKWRCHKFALRGDITKMYRQIKVYDEDVNYQRMVFRFNKNEPIQDFMLNTLTFGTASAPYMAIRSMMQVAIDNAEKMPLGSKVIQNDFHVDDLLTGAGSIEEVKEIWSQVTQILGSAKFPMRKWSSNNNEVLTQIPKEEREFKESEIKMEDSLKTLGIGWLPISDQFFFSVPEFEREKILTKRNFLSQAARLFDPLGWLGPVVMKPKIMFQELWKEKLSWDEKMPKVLAEEWESFREKLICLEKIRIPRWFGFNRNGYQTELHGFSDASEKAYGAVIYLKSTNEVGNSNVEIILAKSRVAPVKKVRLPRLELCGAVLLANMIDMVKTELVVDNAYCWTDSSITLDWINSSADKHKTFVANRISEIQEFTEAKIWRHVEGSHNPADCLSRGINPDELRDHKLWWNAPDWLKLPKHQWPKNPKVKIPEDQLELKKLKTVLTIKKLNSVMSELLERFSSFNVLARVTARIRRLMSKKPKSRILLCKEIEDEKLFWIKSTQEEHFHNEIESLKQNKPLHKNSKLLSLYPFLDADGVLRIGGRLAEVAIEFDAKHQIIIPKESKIAKIIINDAHKITKHGGTQLTMTYTRNRYWIVDARKTIRNQIHKCVTCHRYSEKTQQQLMGNLPQARVNMSRSFLHSGVDYAGPIEILTRRKPGKREVTKGYVAIFVCLCTKAIHLELVSSLTTKAFLAAFTRFTSRRGLPSNMYSDNSTTFIGAKNELEEDMKVIKETLEKELAEIVLKDQVQWSFIPPHAPHWGGIWEAGVKSMKHHVRRVIGNSIHTFEEITTLLAEVEAVLNSRPLCPVSNDPNDLSILTPGHFLIGDNLLSPPRPSLLNYNESRLGIYQQMSQRIEHFAKRWKAEYLATLQHRRKWMRQCENVKVGDLVLIKEDNLPAKKWLMGRVMEVLPDKDGLVRSVLLKTQTTSLMRPITKISILPIDKPIMSEAQ